jgi:hypothetical protein
MKLIRFIPILLAFCFCGASAGENDKQAPPNVALCIYSPTCVVRDKPIDIVVEALNTGAAPMTVFEGVELERVMPPNPHAARINVEKFTPPLDGTVRITVNCHIPAGSQLMHIAQRKKGPLDFKNVVVAPGRSAFIKVPLPLQAFEVGECMLEATSAEGAAKSEPFKINWVSLPGGENKVYQQ